MDTKSKNNNYTAWTVLLLVGCGAVTVVSYPYGESYYPYLRSEIQNRVGTVYLLLLGFSALCVFLLPVFKRLRRESRFIAWFPAEAALVLIPAILSLQNLVTAICMDYFENELACLLCLDFFAYVFMYGVWILAVMAMLQMTDMGAAEFFREKSFFYRNARRIGKAASRWWKQFVTDLRTVDLSEHSDRWLLKLVIINFAVLLICCLFWFWGIFGLFVYSVILFFGLRKYWKQMKHKYNVLLDAAGQMAQGNLQMDIQEDLGMFEPLKEELAKVNQGFRKAVEEEMRSQNMKTELITNVSHDLKTPLTAIITYVNLLKDETITPQERQKYVEILDRKSLRLKKLIEDLFEVSKAASGNIEIERSQVDLCELVKQAAAEQEDRMQAARIDCRVSTPDSRVLLMLDSDKTYRILENLLVNVTKYALAGTRAWVQLEEKPTEVVITVKNISEAELEGDISALTERFVRGDKARNTEGSGLGLAIAKSFAELQGGQFAISTDGDLFKAVVSFPYRRDEKQGKWPDEKTVLEEPK